MARRTPMEKRAVRDIKISQQQTVSELRKQLEGVNNDYAGLQNTFGGMAGHFNDVAGSVGDQLNANLAGLSSALGGNTGVALPEIQSMLPVAEQQAGLNLGTAYGAGAHELLANDAIRNAGYVQSGRREGEYARVSARGNIRQSIMDLFNQRPQLVKQRLDELRQQNLERKLAHSQMAADEATSKYLESIIGDILKTKDKTKGRDKGKDKTKDKGAQGASNPPWHGQGAP